MFFRLQVFLRILVFITLQANNYNQRSLNSKLYSTLSNPYFQLQQRFRIIQNQITNKMANIHGINDYSSQGSNQRRAQLQNQRNRPISMLGINESDLRLMGNQLANNRVPFINIMVDSVQPIQQSIPYTLRLVWCPAFRFFSYSNFLLIAIWILYIISLTQGIDTSQYTVLAATPETLLKYGGFNYQLLKKGEAWRLITASFLNSDILQITMSTLIILFFLTQLQQCYNPFTMFFLTIITTISGNITKAQLGTRFLVGVGSDTIVYGALGGFFAYLTINWMTLYLIRKQLAIIFGIIIFISMIFSIGGDSGIVCFLGAIFGGYTGGLIIFSPIKQRSLLITAIGIGSLAAYWLIMFLVFYLVV